MGEIDRLIIEHVKKFHASHERIERALGELKSRLTQLEVGQSAIRKDLAQLHKDNAIRQVREDARDGRIDRIEKRLELI